jgi:hypothetical protein
MFDAEYYVSKQKIIDIIVEHKDSIAVTGVPGIGKTTILEDVPGFHLPERNVKVRKAKGGSMTLKDQKYLIARCIDELAKKGGIYDRNAIVDGYVFYCLTEEYFVEKAEKENNKKSVAQHTRNLKKFKDWFWLYITDFVRYLDFEFNILFLKSTASREELKDRVLGRNRKRDNFDLMDIFIDKFEDFAMRTLIEIRALGVNINLIEVEL